jgi:hypothetical protein
MNDDWYEKTPKATPLPNRELSDGEVSYLMLNLLSELGSVLDAAARRPVPETVTSGYKFVDYLMKNKRL